MRFFTRSRPRAGWRRAGRLGLLLGAWLALHTLFVIGDGLRDEPLAPGAAALVLGSKVRPSGAPSTRLRGRLERALALYREGRVSLVIVSGGLGREGHQEADVMAAWLIARGVPEGRVVRDPEGNTTFLSARNARALLAARGLDAVVLVSDYYHLPRARLAFRRAGIRRVGTARAALRPGLREPWSLLREFVGYYWYLVREAP